MHNEHYQAGYDQIMEKLGMEKEAAPLGVVPKMKSFFSQLAGKGKSVALPAEAAAASSWPAGPSALTGALSAPAKKIPLANASRAVTAPPIPPPTAAGAAGAAAPAAAAKAAPTAAAATGEGMLGVKGLSPAPSNPNLVAPSTGQAVARDALAAKPLAPAGMNLKQKMLLGGGVGGAGMLGYGMGTPSTIQQPYPDF